MHFKTQSNYLKQISGLILIIKIALQQQLLVKFSLQLLFFS